jgi:hypothetical protein
MASRIIVAMTGGLSLEAGVATARWAQTASGAPVWRRQGRRQNAPIVASVEKRAKGNSGYLHERVLELPGSEL